jgi:hypothetical protein
VYSASISRVWARSAGLVSIASTSGATTGGGAGRGVAQAVSRMPRHPATRVLNVNIERSAVRIAVPGVRERDGETERSRGFTRFSCFGPVRRAMTVSGTNPRKEMVVWVRVTRGS